ncbi:hypothetical protein [Propionicimonas sp.]|uniref:hypothetical protein n=1 Tax=Propionicimonas sp. TaxID=1955623 RepID=UPI0017C9F6E7|nr:hypothetical protein [Propionicimonas sp.]MBU3976650.1 hypothetical protein [Actinomycetota bacterium]MBA3020351.1 hypothetical protein [Propionicimonas sp.]MBU3986523.1 hypothetical protein [Actinomycetota bacterium]MBU4007325.1 hypothetical protein [Actinomycetota bacterium]MBU4065078.1 hypothetical protein [Actinomycetota bacterium]
MPAQNRLGAPDDPPTHQTSTAHSANITECLTSLQFGLLEDLQHIVSSSRRQSEPHWNHTAILGDLPRRFRPQYDVGFTFRLAAVGFELVGQASFGPMTPRCPAQAFLAEWVLKQWLLIKSLGGADPPTAGEMAEELGLVGPTTSFDPALRGAPHDWFQASPQFSHPNQQHYPWRPAPA